MTDLGTWMVAAYNPSTVDQKLLRFSVPSTSSFEVHVIGADQTWVPAKSDMLCYTATKDDVVAETFEECELMIEAAVAAQTTTYLKVKTQSNATKKTQASNENTIYNENLLLSYLN